MGRFYGHFSSALGTSVLAVAGVDFMTHSVRNTPLLFVGVLSGCLLYAYLKTSYPDVAIRVVSPIQLSRQTPDSAA